jgi:hypothetical protein
MITQYDFITYEFPKGYFFRLEACFYHGIYEDEKGWFDIYLN